LKASKFEQTGDTGVPEEIPPTSEQEARKVEMEVLEVSSNHNAGQIFRELTWNRSANIYYGSVAGSLIAAAAQSAAWPVQITAAQKTLPLVCRRQCLKCDFLQS
jgi:hypothetical protein